MTAESARKVEIPLEDGERTTAILYPAWVNASKGATLILGHGAGAGQHHPFMVAFAQALSERGVDVLTFNFLYMQRRRRIPDPMPRLVACYRAVIAWAAAARGEAEHLGEHAPGAEEGTGSPARLFIGGKSMGGRVATHVAAVDPLLPVNGIVLLGYPLHPPGRADRPRDAHLPDVRRPMLFVQGSRDAFGTPGELEPILGRLSPVPVVHAVEGGDHSFKIPGRDASKQAAINGAIVDAIVVWMERI